MLSGSLMDTHHGTSYYIAPEVHLRKAALELCARDPSLPLPPMYAGEPVDVWALGVSALIMLFGKYVCVAWDACCSGAGGVRAR